MKKLKEKKKVKAKNNSSLQYKATATCSGGSKSITGVIEQLDTNGVVISYKLKRKSKYERKIIPNADIISVEGVEGGPGTVTYQVRENEVAAFKGEAEILDNGFVRIISDEGEALVKASHANIIALDEEKNSNIKSRRGRSKEAPKKAEKSKDKKDKTAKKKKKGW